MGQTDCTGLVAVRREVPPLLRFFQVDERESYGDAILQRGSIHGRSVALAEVPPGPVNAALGAQALVARHGAARLIAYGTAVAVTMLRI